MGGRGGGGGLFGAGSMLKYMSQTESSPREL